MFSRDCAIYFNQEAYSLENSKLMGRNSAGASFLKGYFLNGNPKNFWVYCRKREHAQVFADWLSRSGSRKGANYISFKKFFELKAPGNIFYPGPNISQLAWQRRFEGETAWSICGITHTTASAGVMDAIGEYYVGPVKSWDALICTSHAVKRNVEFILEQKKIYLEEELGLEVFISPKLPVIPLGINADDFQFSKNEKHNARNILKIDQDSLIITYVGRLSFHAKANPIAMYLAIEKAALLNPEKKIKVIECGWFANDKIRKAFSELANQLLTKVELIHIDGRQQDNVKLAWQSADIFCSLSDNIQETFGISPVEAMASGLPVVVSDWNGYKETVRDNIDGFRISTLMPESGLGRDLAISHALELVTYDQYIAKSSSFIAIDIEQAVDRFDRLIKSDDLRYRLGQNGKNRVFQQFDWKVIIPQYEELWSILGEERAKYADAKSGKVAWPERPDPFGSFSHYPTVRLDKNRVFGLVSEDYAQIVENFQKYKKFQSNNSVRSVLLLDEEFLLIFQVLEHKNLSSKDILKNFNKGRRPMIYRNLFWLLKMGLLKSN